MHATHQFFLTRRSLYLLVLDGRQGENENNLHYWLKIIQSYAEDSPILVVINKSDQHQMELNENRLQKDYAPNLRGFYHTSCKNGEGIAELRSAIVQQIPGLSHVFDLLPESYFKVKDSLAKRATKDNYLQYQQYINICRKHRVTSEDDQRQLIRFLHDLGTVLNYDDPDSPLRLHDTNILNPEWVTEGVYKIVNNNVLMNQQGQLDVDQLTSVFNDPKRYPPERHRFIIDMMRKFELCFAFPDSDNRRYLIPELLPENEPDLDWSEHDSLRFEYHYNVLPSGILCRFIVHMHHRLTEKRTYWRSGVLLDIDGNRCLVRGDTQSKKMFISIQGPAQTRRIALSLIREAFHVIHRTIPGMEAVDKVPLHGGTIVTYGHWLMLEAKGIATQIPDGTTEPVNVSRVLDTIADKTQRDRDRQILSINVENLVMGDKYEIGQAGAAGPHSHAHDMTFQQLWNQAGNQIDLQTLASELSALRAAMREHASGDPEEDLNIGNVAAAEKSASEGDGPKALEHLKSAGKWAFDVATKIGTGVATAALKTALGL